ncbi:MAG: hypothetical protein C4293_02840 [Nitrospiraceae bacterium]
MHTANAVAAARGTYFVVWIENDQTTGLMNIGDKGNVAFTAAGQTVIVKPGYYSTAAMDVHDHLKFPLGRSSEIPPSR